jgi:hypothetical protein
MENVSLGNVMSYSLSSIMIDDKEYKIFIFLGTLNYFKTKLKVNTRNCYTRFPFLIFKLVFFKNKKNQLPIHLHLLKIN